MRYVYREKKQPVNLLKLVASGPQSAIEKTFRWWAYVGPKLCTGWDISQKQNTTNEVTYETAPLHSPEGDFAVCVVSSATA